MAKITERALIDALELGDAKEFFDILACSMDERLRHTIEEAFVRIAVMVFDDSDNVSDLFRKITAAEWTAFSAGWTLRGLADGKG